MLADDLRGSDSGRDIPSQKLLHQGRVASRTPGRLQRDPGSRPVVRLRHGSLAPARCGGRHHASSCSLPASLSVSRWREADRYYELSQRGWSTRRIAQKCDTNRQTVSLFTRVVSRYRDTSTRPVFRHANSEVSGEKPKQPAVGGKGSLAEWDLTV
jgi:hypothetical protein